MRKIVKVAMVSAMALALVSGPVMAQHNHRHHGYRGGWVAPLIGGAIIGGVIANQYRSAPGYYPPVQCGNAGCYDYRNMTPVYPAPQAACWEEQRPVYDRYGRYHGIEVVQICQ
jgi:hypothetical protein